MSEGRLRTTPLVVVGTTDRTAAQPVAATMRAEGAVVVVAEGDRACLRAATSLSPDVVLLNPRLSPGLLGLLKRYPLVAARGGGR
jgi:DNA-binding response OmpR family regulator